MPMLPEVVLKNNTNLFKSNNLVKLDKFGYIKNKVYFYFSEIYAHGSWLFQNSQKYEPNTETQLQDHRKDTHMSVCVSRVISFNNILL